MKDGWNKVVLGAAPQWVSLRGRNARDPVLLWLHGGPGGAEYGPRRKFLRGLESSWLVADWEQRGAGRSFTGMETASTLSLDRLVDDGLDLVALLCRELGRDKVVLVGHSFGTVLGVLMAAKDPSHISAYVGAAQVVTWSVQEERSYDWTLAEARSRGDDRGIAALEALGRPVAGMYAEGISGVPKQRRYLGTYGGVCGDPSFLTRWMMSILFAPGYPVGAKLRFTRGMDRSMSLVWPELCRRIDFARQVKSLAVPVHLFMGDADRITDLRQVEAWSAALQAPVKRLEVVAGAGHLGVFEAPREFQEFLAGARP